MTDKLKKAFFTEKIPAILCAMACMASVLMGFLLGFVFFGPLEPVPAYAGTHYQDEPYLAEVVMPAEIYEPVIHAFTEPPEERHLYIVTALDGYIVVYHAEKNGGEIKVITTTAISALGPEEQERLLAGIPIYTDEALVRILQDYGS